MRRIPSGAASISGRGAHARTPSARTTAPAPGARVRFVRTRAGGEAGLQAEDDWMRAVFTQALHDAPRVQELHVQSLVADRY